MAAGGHIILSPTSSSSKTSTSNTNNSCHGHRLPLSGSTTTEDDDDDDDDNNDNEEHITFGSRTDTPLNSADFVYSQVTGSTCTAPAIMQLPECIEDEVFTNRPDSTDGLSHHSVRTKSFPRTWPSSPEKEKCSNEATVSSNKCPHSNRPAAAAAAAAAAAVVATTTSTTTTSTITTIVPHKDASPRTASNAPAVTIKQEAASLVSPSSCSSST